jgi:hypothetical protein
VPAVLFGDGEVYVDLDGMLQAIEHGTCLYLSEQSGAAFTGKSYLFLFPTTLSPT